MKSPRTPSDLRWEKLLARARNDTSPPADLPALLHAIRHASVAPREGWAAEFFAVFAAGHIVSACLAGAGVFASITAWQVWTWWQMLPWAEFLAVTGGGAS